MKNFINNYNSVSGDMIQVNTFFCCEDMLQGYLFLNFPEVETC